MIFDHHFARQPIVDRDGTVTGYEILYRASPRAVRAGRVDGSGATGAVLAAAFGDGDDLLGGLPGFVNLPRCMVVDRTLLRFDPARVGAEILEDVRPDREVLAALTELREAGFVIALDDFRPSPEVWRLLEVADVVKLDIRSLAGARLRAAVEAIAGSGASLLAEKVETSEELAACTDLGFDLFQGYLLGAPELISVRRLDEEWTRLMRVVAAGRMGTSAVSHLRWGTAGPLSR